MRPRLQRDERRAVGEPARHQVEELPMITVEVTEHRAQRVRCPGCGATVRGELPAEVAASAFGPGLQGGVATLSVRNRVSRRDVVELAEELFGARTSAGSVDAILARAGEALARPMRTCSRAYAAHERCTWTRPVGAPPVSAARCGGRSPNATPSSPSPPTAMRIAPRPCSPTLRRSSPPIAGGHMRTCPCAPPALLGAPAARLPAHAEGLAAEREFGLAGLELCERVFWAWEVFCHTHERRELQRTIRQLRRTYKPIIQSHAAKRARNNAVAAWRATS